MFSIEYLKIQMPRHHIPFEIKNESYYVLLSIPTFLLAVTWNDPLSKRYLLNHITVYT